MTYTSKQNSKKTALIWGIVIIGVILAVVFYLQTDNAGSEIAIAPTGGTSNVFIDRSQVGKLQSTSSPTGFSVSEGSHDVLVAQDGYWPWTDTVDVTSGTSTVISPFIIEETGKQVLQTTEEVKSGLEEAQQETLPTADNPILSTNDNVRAYVDGGSNIIAQWNQGTSTAPAYFNCHEGTCGVSVYNQAPVQQLSFYPKRDDVLFFSTQAGVYAIEIDPTGNTQNFQPVIQGVSNPIFTFNNGNIFVFADGQITVSNI